MVSTLFSSSVVPSTRVTVVDPTHAPVARPVVLVIDDHALFAEAIVLTLQRRGLDARRAMLDVPDLAAFVIAQQPDLVLLDLLLGEELDRSISTLIAVARARVRVLVVTGSDDCELRGQCVRLGALGVVGKDEPLETLVQRVHRAVSSRPVVASSDVIARARQAPDFDLLTPRERQVLDALIQGHAAGWIARDHETSLLTVRTHIRSILHKLDVHSQLEAVSLARLTHWCS